MKIEYSVLKDKICILSVVSLFTAKKNLNEQSLSLLIWSFIDLRIHDTKLQSRAKFYKAFT